MHTCTADGDQRVSVRMHMYNVQDMCMCTCMHTAEPAGFVLSPRQGCAALGDTWALDCAHDAWLDLRATVCVCVRARHTRTRTRTHTHVYVCVYEKARTSRDV